MQQVLTNQCSVGKNNNIEPHGNFDYTSVNTVTTVILMLG